MPKFNTFLDEFCRSDENRKRCVKGLMCHVLLATTAEPDLFYFFGEEKSGISILVDTLRGLVGDSSVRVSTLDTFNEINFQEFSFAGVRLLIVIRNTDHEKNNTNLITKAFQTFQVRGTINVIILDSEKLQTSYLLHIKSFKAEVSEF